MAWAIPIMGKLCSACRFDEVDCDSGGVLPLNKIGRLEVGADYIMVAIWSLEV